MALEKQTAESLGLTLSVHTPESVQAAESNHKDNNQGKDEEHEPEEQEESEPES